MLAQALGTAALQPRLSGKGTEAQTEEPHTQLLLLETPNHFPNAIIRHHLATHTSSTVTASIWCSDPCSHATPAPTLGTQPLAALRTAIAAGRASQMESEESQSRKVSTSTSSVMVPTIRHQPSTLNILSTTHVDSIRSHQVLKKCKP